MLFAFAPHRAYIVAVVLAAAVTGCGDAGGPVDPLGQSAAALSAADQTAFDYFVGKGLTTFQAAGIVGNLDQESNMEPTAVQAGGPGRGIAQWSVGGRWDTDSGDNLLAYASAQGESSTSLQLQLEFIWYELTSFSSYGLGALRATTNVTDATVVFETDFEGCGECDQSTRISYAEAALAAYGSPTYAAEFVSQSFPLATTALMMTAGEIVPSYIELKNVGTKTWDSKTRIGTTQPRDRASVFAASTWISSSRPAGVTGTVPPGGTYKFTFDLAAPSTPGTYDEFFGVLEEGDVWFGDPGQGGPPDDDLEVKITVVAGPDEPVDAGEPHDADAPHDAGVPKGDAGHGDASTQVGDSGVAEENDGGFATSSPAQPGGCSMGRAGGRAPTWSAGLAMMFAVVVRRRVRSKHAIGREARR
jgi:Phage tail lysozyme/Ig-like domain from next to BRCA1 gene